MRILVFALLLGVLLRAAWPLDMEYKDDERLMAKYAFDYRDMPRYPWVGMASSAGIANPGFSVWIFQAPAQALGWESPVSLQRWVVFLNLFALALLVFFVFRVVPLPERHAWVWATAFMAVNPMAILFSRKIWEQCALPVFVIPFLMAWWTRDKKWSAFFWGLLGALLGQVHMSGFFFAASVFLFTAMFRRQGIRWIPYIGGSVLGALPLIPWLQAIQGQAHASPMPWRFSLQFWRYWITDSLGLELSYSLRRSAFMDFLRYPLVEGHAIYLVGALHLMTGVLALALFIQLCRVWRRKFTVTDDSSLLLISAFFGFGIFVTASGSYPQHHYLIVAYPLLWLGLARLAEVGFKRADRVLAALIIAQMMISIAFLSYIHVNGGAKDSDYGVTYRRQ